VALLGTVFSGYLNGPGLLAAEREPELARSAGDADQFGHDGW
jgi:hypothetical protein